MAPLSQGHEFEQTLGDSGVGDREAGRAAVHGVRKSRTRPSEQQPLPVMQCCECSEIGFSGSINALRL